MKTLLLLIAFTWTSLVFSQSKNEVQQLGKEIPDNANFYLKQKQFDKKWKNRTAEKGQGYNVFKRWERLMEPRVYPSGDITLPSSNYENFIKWQKENEGVNARYAPNNWTALGPFAKPSGYDSGVGRVDFLRFMPGTPTTMFVGTPDGGLWKSTNGGSSWATNSDFLPVIGCSDLVIDPTNTQIMYLATGNWEGERYSIGVLKSIDGGTSWAATNLTWPTTDKYVIRRMIMDPVNPGTIMVATDGGVFRTTDGFVNTLDNSGLNFSHNLNDIKFKPGDHLTVYASGTGGADGVGSGVFWKSIDNGVNWNVVSSGLPANSAVSRIIIGTAPSNADYVYLLAGNGNGGYLGLYRSINGGTTFLTMSTTPNLLQSSKTGAGTGGQATHDLAIAVAPDNANKVTIGGINQWRSTDGGVNWNLFTYWLGIDPDHQGEGSDAPYTHADIQDIQYLPGSLPGSSATLFTTADGGIYKTTDDGTTFSDLSNNLSIAQQTNVAQSAGNANIIVTGLQDIGTIKKSGSDYSVINGGDGESAFIDRTSDLVIVTSNPNGAHEISYDGGVNKSTMTGIPAGNEFYSPISQDPTNVDIMYAGGRSQLYKNPDWYNNTPTSWTTVGTLPGTNSVLEYTAAPSSGLINAGSQIIYVIKSDMISKTTNGGTSWTNVTNGLPLGSARATQITVSNTDANKAWITFSGYSAANKVWKTIDGGSSWTNISSGLPNLPVNTVVFVKNSPKDEVYIGMDIGVYQYENPPIARGPGSWSLYNMGLANAKVTDLEIFYPETGSPRMRASTYGRGTWETEIQGALVPVELVEFVGKVTDTGNSLSWKTSEEVNLDKYEVERSLDGKNYKKIGNVSPNTSNSITLESYQFLDRQTLEGLSYYRLKIVDLDGSYDYSNTVVLFNEESGGDLIVSPNPTSDFVKVLGLSDRNAVAIIRDVTGRVISSTKITSDSQVMVNYLPNGNYFIEVLTDSGLPKILRFTKI